MRKFPAFATALGGVRTLAVLLAFPSLCAAPAATPALGRSPTPPSLPDLASACAGHEGWSDPAPPRRIFANTWYVGTCGISAVLITSSRGHILIDGGPVGADRLIVANIRRAGFVPRDVRWIVSSHEHVDHAGGLAALKAQTGARLAALPAAARVLEGAPSGPDDPQGTSLDPVPPVKVDRVLRDGEVLTAGSLQLTVHATPGHAPGSTSWTWKSCMGKDCRDMAYVDSISALSAGGWRFSDHPAYVAAFRRSLAKITTLPCTFLITPHPGASDLFERLKGAERPADPSACRTYAARGARALDETLAKEAAAPQRPRP